MSNSQEGRTHHTAFIECNHLASKQPACTARSSHETQLLDRRCRSKNSLHSSARVIAMCSPDACPQVHSSLLFLPGIAGLICCYHSPYLPDYHFQAIQKHPHLLPQTQVKSAVLCDVQHVFYTTIYTCPEAGHPGNSPEHQQHGKSIKTIWSTFFCRQCELYSTTS